MRFQIVEKQICLKDESRNKEQILGSNLVASHATQLIDVIRPTLSKRALKGFLFSELERSEGGNFHIQGNLNNAYISDIEFIPQAVTLPLGKFTVVLDDGSHLTFWAHEIKNGEMKGKRVLSLFTGTQNDNWQHYTGLGFLNETSFNPWKKVKDMAYNNSRIKDALQWGEIMAFASQDDWLTWGTIYALESQKCWHCGRELTTPDSLENCIGKNCAKKLGVPYGGSK